MVIYIASDHAGFELKKAIIEFLKGSSHKVHDLGTHSTKPVDYPDYAEKLGLQVAMGKSRGILICGSGVGASIAVNKIPHIRAAICHDTYSAHQGVEHDDMNVLTIGARVVGLEPAKEIVSAFLKAKFSNEERHVRRLKKVKALEASYLCPND